MRGLQCWVFIVLLVVNIVSDEVRRRRRRSSSVDHSAKVDHTFKEDTTINIFLPTVSELDNVLIIPPPDYWGMQMLEERSLRLLVIGGRNSIPAATDTSTPTSPSNTYVQLLQDWLSRSTASSQSTHGAQGKKKRSSSTTTSSSSMSQYSANSYVRQSPTSVNDLQQRLSQNIKSVILGLLDPSVVNQPKSWPNVILIEHSQDCKNADPLECIYIIEKLLFRIFKYYEVANLPRPDVVFVELLKVNKFYQHPALMAEVAKAGACSNNEVPNLKELYTHRSKLLNPSADMNHNDRGSSFGVSLVEYARFYRFPVLSVTDSWYPSFVRHMLTTVDNCKLSSWPMMEKDGIQLSALGHASVFQMIKTLIESRKATKSTSSTHFPYAVDLKFCKKDLYSEYPNVTRVFSISPSDVTENSYLPTEEELHRINVVKPSETWGLRVLKEKSLRILTLGGSNTANKDNYVDELRFHLFTNKSRVLPGDLNISSSYVFNGGISGWGPTVTKLSFETDLPPSQWPNVIMMEYSVNCGHNWDCVRGTERVRYYYEKLYTRHNVPLPDYLFLELFRAGDMSSRSTNCDTNHLINDHNVNVTKLIFPTDKYRNRGSAFAMQLAEYARFYRLPIISLTDALYPSMIRYIDSHLSCALWPFTRDNVHIHEEGQKIAVDSIINFFEQQLLRLQEVTKSRPSSSAQLEDLSNIISKLRIFPAESYQAVDIVSQHRLWGPNHDRSFEEIILAKSDFQQTYLRNHNDGKHDCMGTTKAGAKVSLKAEIHPIFLKNFRSKKGNEVAKFTLVLGVLHSWDKSYIGSMKCGLYPRKGANKLSDKPIVELTIHAYQYENKEVHDSTPRNIIITKELTGKEHMLECENLEENKLSCITHVSIYSNED